jgi:hypothetical protein
MYVCTELSERLHLWLGKWILHHQNTLSYTAFLVNAFSTKIHLNTSVSMTWPHEIFIFLKLKIGLKKFMTAYLTESFKEH